jgi:hypothetical protein
MYIDPLHAVCHRNHIERLPHLFVDRSSIPVPDRFLFLLRMTRKNTNRTARMVCLDFDHGKPLMTILSRL